MKRGIGGARDPLWDSCPILAPIWVVALLLLALTLLASCAAVTSQKPEISPPPLTELPGLTLKPEPTASPAGTMAADPVLPTPTSIPTDTGWRRLRPGLERRLIRLQDGDGKQFESLYVLRLDPSLFHFGVAYSPGKPRTLLEWQEITDALVVVNGGFFTEDFRATGLTVANGTIYGESFTSFGGMLAIDKVGPALLAIGDGQNIAAETLDFALQSFPVLVNESGAYFYSQVGDKRARRTVVAQDKSGNILFIIAPWGTFTLAAMSAYLVESDMEIAIALNLDGGASAGLVLKEPEEGYPAFVALPAVITVSPR